MGCTCSRDSRAVADPEGEAPDKMRRNLPDDAAKPASKRAAGPSGSQHQQAGGDARGESPPPSDRERRGTLSSPSGHDTTLFVHGHAFGSKYLDALRDTGSDNPCLDMLMIGDFGKDLDDEKAVVMAVAMRRVGLIEKLTVVANLGDSVMRARLAKGTVNALGAHDVRVGVGSDGGRPNEEIHEYEFMACPYLAPESELHPQGGHELAFRALEEAKAAGRQLAIVLNSAMTDMAAMIDDPRWEQLAPGVISSVVVMGGVREDADGRVRLDPTAANNTFDLPSSTKMHERLQADERIRFAIVTRHCASACQMPRCAFDGSLHPVALRLTAVAKPSLQKLWERTHRSQQAREQCKDALPMRCDPAWFCDTFLQEGAPASMGPADDIWPYVRGFNEYDGLATVVAATISHPALFELFFKPSICPHTGTVVVGRTSADQGILNSAKASEMLHDLVVNAFERRFRRGLRVEIRGTGKHAQEWHLAILARPRRGQGPDSWVAISHLEALGHLAGSTEKTVHLAASTEGLNWRMVQSLGDQEPVFNDQAMGIRYRTITLSEGHSVRAMPFFHSQAAWEELRHGFSTQPGDIFSTGYLSSGNLLCQCAALTLLAGGDASAVDLNVDGGLKAGNLLFLELAISRGQIGAQPPPHHDIPLAPLLVPADARVASAAADPHKIDQLPPASRVFKSHMPPRGLPCRLAADGVGLPAGLKIVHPVRDPRDVCVAAFEFLKLDGSGSGSGDVDMKWDQWVEGFISGKAPWGGWLQQNKEWWDASRQQPEQVLWTTFEDCVANPTQEVRRIADFLGLQLPPERLEATARAITIGEMEKRYTPEHPGLLKERRTTGEAREHFSAAQLEQFDEHVIQPALDCGMRLRLSSPSRAVAPSERAVGGSERRV